MRRACKLRLYPTRRQEAALIHWCDASRWAWNTCLDWRETLYRRAHAKVSGQYWFSKVVTRWRKSEEFAWLAGVPSDVFTKKLEDQDRAYRNFFEGRGRYPRFKRKRDRQSVRVNLDHRHRGKVLAWANGDIVAPTLGRVRVRGRKLPGVMAKQLTFSREPSGRWFVSFAVEDAVEPWPAPVNVAVGVDLGVKTAATIATDAGVRKVDNQRLMGRFRHRERGVRQRLARQVRGSNRRERTRRALARVKERQANCRRDFLHQLTTRTVRENQAIAVEDLNVSGMTKSAKGTAGEPGRNVRAKSGLNREVLSVAFGEFRRQLEYKAVWHGRSVYVVPRFMATSKACAACETLNPELVLSQREWTCAQCGAEHDRDVNAARNIRAYGLEQHREERGKCTAVASDEVSP